LFPFAEIILLIFSVVFTLRHVKATRAAQFPSEKPGVCVKKPIFSLTKNNLQHLPYLKREIGNSCRISKEKSATSKKFQNNSELSCDFHGVG
jgi:hypothetical protein